MSRVFNMREKLAAALALLAGVPFEHRKLMTADQIISLFQFDHDPHPHAAPFHGPSVHWNCTPRLIADHREKTAKKDVPMISRVRRVSAENEEFRRRILARHGQDEAPPKSKSRWPKRKMQSRGFAGHRKFDGTPVFRNGRKP